MTSNSPNNALSGSAATPTSPTNAAPSGPSAATTGPINAVDPGLAAPLHSGPIYATPSGPSAAPTGLIINAAPTTGGPQTSAPLLQPLSFSFASPVAVNAGASANGTVLIPLKNIQKKRKNAAPAINIMRRKRIRPTLIDDRVAISFFRELRMTRQFIHSGAILAWALQPTDQDFINIHDYVERGQEHGYGIKIIAIIRIIAAATSLASDSQVVDFNDDPQTKGQRRMMLWHGTKRRCLTNILQNGLRMPTYSGQMFGPGIYFADRVSKSCNYCDRNADGGFLLLCDVLLGTSYESHNAIPRLRSSPLKPGGIATQSVLGLGRRIPDPGWDMKIDGTIWPMGRTVDRNDSSAYLQFNEYIVYDSSQVVPKYLVKFQVTQSPVRSILY